MKISIPELELLLNIQLDVICTDIADSVTYIMYSWLYFSKEILKHQNLSILMIAINLKTGGFTISNMIQ